MYQANEIKNKHRNEAVGFAGRVARVSPLLNTSNAGLFALKM
jgi:hypothetical protein